MINQLKTARILLVDDETVNLKILRKMLETQGFFNLVEVQDAREAIHQYCEAPTDLVLLDLNMPFKDGYDLMSEFQAVDEPVHAPIVVLTAQHGQEFLLRALNSGARDYITKPFDMAELIARVRNMLEVHLAHKMVYAQKETLDSMVRLRTADLLRTRMQVIQRLGRAAEYRDNETGQHVLRVSHTAALMGQHLGWDQDSCEMFLHATPMHDVGKIGIPDRILLKPASLDPDEWKIMKTHTTIGADLLGGEDSELFRLAQTIACSHHEKWDGSGYPRGTKGVDIPQPARIVAIVDVFDALTSTRPYKKAWPVADAISYIHKQSGQHFDPSLVQLFENLQDDIHKIRLRFTDSDTDSIEEELGIDAD